MLPSGRRYLCVVATRRFDRSDGQLRIRLYLFTGARDRSAARTGTHDMVRRVRVYRGVWWSVAPQEAFPQSTAAAAFRIEGVGYRLVIIILGGLILALVSFYLMGGDMVERYV